MASRRDLIEAEDFQRRRGVAALTRGDTLDVEEVPRRPNAALLLGVVLALLIGAGSAVTAFVGGRAPDGWRGDGSLVVDKETGARYVAQGGALRPTPTLTAALLAGARAKPVLVAHTKVTEAPIGLPLAGNGTPEAPPVVPPAPAELTACVTGPSAIDVFTDPPVGTAVAATGLLARPIGSSQLVLVAGRRRYATDETSAVALGYSLTQVREVPAFWLDLVPRGPDLVLQRPVPSAGGVPGVGAGGDTVTSAESGRRFLISAGTVRPLANETSALLAPPPVRTVPEAALLAAPAGPPAGLVDAPSVPPIVPPREAVVQPCVRSSDGLLTVTGGVTDGSATRPTPTRETGSGPNRTRTTWHFPPGQGVLLGPPDLARPQPPGASRRDQGLQVVDAGVGYRVVGDDVLRSLGYRPEQASLVAPSWFALLAPGVPLVGRA